MKNNDIEKLLGKYVNGDISEDELHALSSMTHRNEVMMSAMATATKIRKKRRTTIASVVSVMVLVCGVGLFMRPMWMDSEKVEIAKVAVEPVPVETVSVNPLVEMEENESEYEDCKSNTIEVKTPTKVASPLNKTEDVAIEEEVTIEEIQIIEATEIMHTDEDRYSIETQVLCNVQCDADEVINEVWDFLRT